MTNDESILRSSLALASLLILPLGLSRLRAIPVIRGSTIWICLAAKERRERTEEMILPPVILPDFVFYAPF